MDIEHIRVFGNMNAATFYQTPEWRRLRYRALTEYGNRCSACGRGPKHGVALHVDHIKPRSLFPDSCLDFHNLQVLCEDCNLAKADGFIDDFRSGYLKRSPSEMCEFFSVLRLHLVLMSRPPRNRDESDFLGLHTKCSRKKLRQRWRALVDFCFKERVAYPEAIKVRVEQRAKFKSFRGDRFRRFFHGKQPADFVFEMDGCPFPDDLVLLLDVGG